MSKRKGRGPTRAYLNGYPGVANFHWTEEEINSRTLTHYVDYLINIAAVRFKWINLPDSISPRYLNIMLTKQGSVGIVWNRDIGAFMAVAITGAGRQNIYGDYTYYRCITADGLFNKMLPARDVLPIWLNETRTSIMQSILLYARRLADADRVIDVNIRGQKSPVIIETDEQNRVTINNMFAQVQANKPAILGKQVVDLAASAVHFPMPEYIADKVGIDKKKIWYEFLSFLGIDNANTDKRERLIDDEVRSNEQEINIARMMFLTPLRDACDTWNNPKKWAHIPGAQLKAPVSVVLNLDYHSDNYDFTHSIEDMVNAIGKTTTNGGKEEVMDNEAQTSDS